MEFNPKNIKHFGKVYIRSNKAGSWSLLDSACFSKLDLRIYSEDRTNLHPNYYNLTGKLFSLGNRIKNPNLLDETEEEYSGKFLAPIKHGENPSPDLEHLPDAFEVELKSCQEMKLVSTNNAEEHIKSTLACAFWTFCMPGKPILEQEFVHSTTPLLYLDDAHEGYGNEMISSNFKEDIHMSQPYRKLVELVTKASSETGGTAMDAINVLFDSNNNELEANMSSSAIMGFCELISKIRNSVTAVIEKALETAKKNQISADSYIKVFSSSAMAIYVEICTEWRNKAHAEFIPTITEIHKDSVLGYLIAESIALQKGIELTERIRANPLFQIYISLFKTNFVKVNDIISYRREADSEENSNEIYLLHKGKGWPLDKAIKKVEDDANQATEQLVKVAELLLKMYPESLGKEHENLKRYLKTTRQILIGHMQYYTLSKRYHPGMVYDCYVEE